MQFMINLKCMTNTISLEILNYAISNFPSLQRSEIHKKFEKIQITIL